MFGLQSVFNRFEKTAYVWIRKQAESMGFEVVSKIRIADVISLPRKHSLFRFAQCAHFDFLITQGDHPIVAVEFDSRDHFEDSKKRDNDEKKNMVCKEDNLPLLRIDSQFLRPIHGTRITVLEWLIKLWLWKYEERVNLIDHQAGRKIIDYAVHAMPRTATGSKVSEKLHDTTYGVSPVAASELDPFHSVRHELDTNFSETYNIEFSDDAVDGFGYAIASVYWQTKDNELLIGKGRCPNTEEWPVDSAMLAQDLARQDALYRFQKYNAKHSNVAETKLAPNLRNAFASRNGVKKVIDSKCFLEIPFFMIEEWLVPNDVRLFPPELENEDELPVLLFSDMEGTSQSSKEALG